MKRNMTHTSYLNCLQMNNTRENYLKGTLLLFKERNALACIDSLKRIIEGEGWAKVHFKYQEMQIYNKVSMQGNWVKKYG